MADAAPLYVYTDAQGVGHAVYPSGLGDGTVVDIPLGGTPLAPGEQLPQTTPSPTNVPDSSVPVVYDPATGQPYAVESAPLVTPWGPSLGDVAVDPASGDLGFVSDGYLVAPGDDLSGLATGGDGTVPVPDASGGVPVDDGSGGGGGTYYEGSYDGGGYTYGYQPSYHSGGGGSSGGYYASGSGESYRSSGAPTVPVYANGTVHPFFGGQMPGSYFPSGSGSTQKDASVPGGAAAGGWGARSAPPVSTNYGAGGGGGSSGGGGGSGSIAKSMYWRIRNAVESKVGGMGPGGYGGGYSPYHSSGYSSSPTPAPPEPDDSKLHGFSKKYDRLNAEGTAYGHPELIIPKALGLPTDSGGYQALADLPIGPLADIMSSWKSPTQDVGRFMNAASRMYKTIAMPGIGMPDFGVIEHRLFNPKKGSSLGVSFGMGEPPLTPMDEYNKKLYGKQWVDPRDSYQPPAAGAQIETIMPYLHAINTLQYGSKYGETITKYDQMIADAWAAQQLKKKLGKGQTLPHFLGKHIAPR